MFDNIRRLRSNQTDAERVLWEALRDRRFDGKKFRRQHPVGRYVLDFYCHDARLAVELDGRHHAEADAKAYDAERTRFLEAQGIRVIRFWNSEVLRNTGAVLKALEEALAGGGGGPGRGRPSPPAPLPEGEG